MAKANVKAKKETPQGALTKLGDALRGLKKQNKKLQEECKDNQFVWLGIAYENVDKVIDQYIQQVEGAM